MGALKLPVFCLACGRVGYSERPGPTHPPAPGWCDAPACTLARDRFRAQARETLARIGGSR
jgi:hypothetical protein